MLDKRASVHAHCPGRVSAARDRHTAHVGSVSRIAVVFWLCAWAKDTAASIADPNHRKPFMSVYANCGTVLDG